MDSDSTDRDERGDKCRANLKQMHGGWEELEMFKKGNFFMNVHFLVQ